MRFVVQRVTEAGVSIDGKCSGRIGKGFLVLAGVADGRTGLGLEAVNGGLLIVSQFTLYADCKKGNRPSFIRAGKPDMAKEMYEYILKKCREYVPVVEHGEFGADMKVSLLNDGPFTIVLDSDELFPVKPDTTQQGV